MPRLAGWKSARAHTPDLVVRARLPALVPLANSCLCASSTSLARGQYKRKRVFSRVVTTQLDAKQ